VRGQVQRIGSRIAKLEAEPVPADDGDDDPAPFDWYADTCPCGRPAGECAVHPRARANQRPPGGDWRTWLMLMGRGAGKTRSGAEWVRSLAESGRARRIALVAPTEKEARRVLIEGESGLLAISPPWARPRYEPSKSLLTWPGGSIATAYSADRPEGLRGPEHDAAWVDELAFWRFPRAWDNLMLGLRIGTDPRVCVTTTPRPTRLVKDLLAAASTATARGSTYENRAHLAPTFFDHLIATYEGTRLGRQELYAEVLDVSDGAWFARFDPARHVSAEAEYDYRFRVHLAIDCGVSRHVGAVFFQVREVGPDKHRVTVFGDYYAEGRFSEANARAIKARSDELPSFGRLDVVRLDPASSARTGVGPAAYGEFERIFGTRVTARWPQHPVLDGLDQLEILLDSGGLLIHPRCTHLKSAFQNYARAHCGGEWLDEPADPQHPHEDLIDALRGGVRDRFPEGRPEAGQFRMVHASRVV
jgi:phage terminase large subunit-like protein